MDSKFFFISRNISIAITVICAIVMVFFIVAGTWHAFLWAFNTAVWAFVTWLHNRSYKATKAVEAYHNA